MNVYPIPGEKSFVRASPVEAATLDVLQAADLSGESAATDPPLGDTSPSEWILIFATWFARSRPNLSAEEVLARAISEFKTCHSLPPEQSAARYRG